MSSEGHMSEGSDVLEESRRAKKQKKELFSSSNHTSEATLIDEAPRKTKKDKNEPKSRPPPVNKVKEKVYEHIAHIFADELSGNNKYVNASEVLQQVIAPQAATVIKDSTTKVHMVSMAVEPIKSSRKSTPEQEHPSSANDIMDSKYKTPGSIFSLDDLAATTALKGLIDRFGKVSHMAILDKSYSFFVSKSRDAALHFKVRDKVAVVGGDPLCEPDKFDCLLAEFAAYRKMFGWSVAFLGTTCDFAAYARRKKWPTMQFGVERVLNPMTNPVLQETGLGKRTITNSKALLKKKVTLGIYIPKLGSNPLLQSQLRDIYTAWCADRNNKPIVQAYITVLDPFAVPELMIYIYTQDISTGQPNGFAALRKIVNGYHLDPCIGLPGAAKGISELLILSAMTLLRAAGVSYLSLGFEPATELGEITSVPKALQGMIRMLHKRAYSGLPIGGKQAFFDKFRPDDAQQRDLYLVVPTRGFPNLGQMKALMHTANIDISRLVFQDVKKSLARRSEEFARRSLGEESLKSRKGSGETLASSRESSRGNLTDEKREEVEIERQL